MTAFAACGLYGNFRRSSLATHQSRPDLLIVQAWEEITSLDCTLCKSL
ncbi:hypothetical protein FOCG_08551 [Fusarium oxysporum f. sp. radicis-lycopersici 26381]|uniref:Uncharacterized protein n=1 Tax=Fusarium oxysporum Fo47 TaxID=660027 RepID=W9JDQ5_FUSOX|nr:hypothetical protein FOZG_17714 [Fusarium oxysporum Fo47]EXL52790.1 hypothetical protein FOCG_08551 [Fusarium oxysporum f. sp. radicis-lycopersici 26381]